jgi:hypothetical protein
MDSYASVLRQSGSATTLCALSHALLQLEPSRPEPWLASTIFMDMRDGQGLAPAEGSRAMEFVDRAIGLDPSHENSYLIKVKDFFFLILGFKKIKL